eukprot:gnl/Trimastix_PCT/3263.p1 GENE.gnl/Trimastix_PCT/3263~~gnl/Trimastix_PCT/3263.p1  ORF type:complete len:1015 (-),score=367.46 gnl/Trimastix_PCT/3263:98-3142(-)
MSSAAKKGTTRKRGSKKGSAKSGNKGTTLGRFMVSDETVGKGAFAVVVKALDTATSEVVAIKQISLRRMRKDNESIDGIMMEINLLRDLSHPNIVHYIDSIRTKDHLNIVLEYVPNGSLQSLVKKFGCLPESVVAMYTLQVLNGLAYLHDQGVIHRDIKGANILLAGTQGQIKLTDFGVSAKIGDGGAEDEVAGTPYWMAPEVIAMAGRTTASDIWSVGCTVIELLTGSPPYFEMDHMPALFRIVQDDHPPIPPGLSSNLNNFLMKCFQKEPDLRATAKQLIAHPWIIKNMRRRQPESSAAQAAPAAAPVAAVAAPRGPTPVTAPATPVQPDRTPTAPSNALQEKLRRLREASEPDDGEDIFGDDFDSPAPPAPAPAPAQAPRALPTGPQRIVAHAHDNQRFYDPKIGMQQSGLDKYTERDESMDMFGDDDAAAPIDLQQRLRDRMKNVHTADEDNEDTWDGIDDQDDGDDAEREHRHQEIQREYMQQEEVRKLIKAIDSSAPPDKIVEACGRLVELIEKNAALKESLITHHGVVPLMELLDVDHTEIRRAALHVINTALESNRKLQETACFVGLIPAVMRFASNSHPTSLRTHASRFSQTMLNGESELTMQMFIASRSLNSMVDLLDPDYAQQKPLVLQAVRGLWGIFYRKAESRVLARREHTALPKNDLCRIFCKTGLLSRLAMALRSIREENTEHEALDQIIKTILFFSRADASVQVAMCDPLFLRLIMEVLPRLSDELLAVMIRAISNLCMCHDALQPLENAGMIGFLVDFFNTRQHKSVLHHVLLALYYLTLHERRRQQQCATAGAIPHLLQVVTSNSPLKQFALPILYSFARGDSTTLAELWRSNMVEFYLSLLGRERNEHNAVFEAIHAWTLSEPTQVGAVLARVDNLTVLLRVFADRTDLLREQSLVRLTDAVLGMVQMSETLNKAAGRHELLTHFLSLAQHANTSVQINVLTVIKLLYEKHDHAVQFIHDFNLFALVQPLADAPKVLVQKRATEILQAFEANAVL